MGEHKESPRGAASSHPLGYVQSSDPGAVGAFRPWSVTDNDDDPTTWSDIKFRNADNNAWISLADSLVVAAPVTSVFGRTGAIVAAEGDYGITQLSDVTIASVVGGHILIYNGSAWVNRVLVAGDIPSLAASIITSGQFSIDKLAVGTPDGTQFIRDDGTLAVPAGTGAPTTVDYLVKTASGSLSAERVVTDGTSITVDWSVSGVATFIRAALTGDVTASADSNVTTIKNDVALAGNPTTTTQAAGNNTTRLATTAFVKAAIDVVLGGVSASFDTLSEIATELALKAPSASPTFTGTVTVPTQSANDNSTKAASTAYADAAAAAAGSSPTIANGSITLAKLADLAQDQFIGRTSASTGVPQTATITAPARTVLDDASVAAMLATMGGAPLASPTFTGTVTLPADQALTGNPTVPTQTAGNNSTRTASTAFVKTALDAQAECIIVAVTDETTAITTGDAKITFHFPFAFTLSSVAAGLSTVSSSGLVTVDVNEAGVTIFSTKITIDASEDHSSTAATPSVLSDTSIAANAKMTVDLDGAGTGAKGLKLYFYGVRA